MSKFALIVLGGVFVGMAGYFFSENVSLAIIGGWVLGLTRKD